MELDSTSTFYPCKEWTDIFLFLDIFMQSHKSFFNSIAITSITMDLGEFHPVLHVCDKDVLGDRDLS